MTLVVICHMTLKNNSGDVSVIIPKKRAFMILVFTQNKPFPPFPYFKCVPHLPSLRQPHQQSIWILVSATI